MPWPNDPCPPGGPTTAADLIAQIILMAHSGGCPDPIFDQIVRRGIACAASAHGPYTGAPPTHCDSIQKALAHAGKAEWPECAQELDHGT
jgi:hypothetical protein